MNLTYNSVLCSPNVNAMFVSITMQRFCVFSRSSSVEAEIKVLTVVNLNKTNEIEARNHLTDGIESALGKRLDVIAITVLGKSHN